MESTATKTSAVRRQQHGGVVLHSGCAVGPPLHRQHTTPRPARGDSAYSPEETPPEERAERGSTPKAPEEKMQTCAAFSDTRQREVLKEQAGRAAEPHFSLPRTPGHLRHGVYRDVAPLGHRRLSVWDRGILSHTSRQDGGVREKQRWGCLCLH